MYYCNIIRIFIGKLNHNYNYMTTSEKITAISIEIEQKTAELYKLQAQLTLEENAAKGISFPHELVDIFDLSYDDFEIPTDSKHSVIEHLTDFCQENVRDIFDFDQWDETDSQELYFAYDNKVYKLEITEGCCVEATHDSRIMEWDAYVTEVTI